MLLVWQALDLQASAQRWLLSRCGRNLCGVLHSIGERCGHAQRGIATRRVKNFERFQFCDFRPGM